MPDKVVAADLDVVLLGEGDQGVGVVEEVAVGLGLDGAELHGVFRDDETVLLGENAGEGVFAEVGGADGASGQQAAFAGVGFEGWRPSMGVGLAAAERMRGRARAQVARAACFRKSRRVIMVCSWLPGSKA